MIPMHEPDDFFYTFDKDVKRYERDIARQKTWGVIKAVGIVAFLILLVWGIGEIIKANCKC